MTTYKISYQKFWYRFLIRSGFFYTLIYLLAIIIWIDLSVNSSILALSTFAIIASLLLILQLLFVFKRTITYLSFVDIGDKALTIRIHRFDRLKLETTIDYDNLDVELYMNFFSVYGTYRLVISEKSKTEKFTFNVIHTQYQTGSWKRSKLKELYSLIRDKQNKLSNTDHIK